MCVDTLHKGDNDDDGDDNDDDNNNNYYYYVLHDNFTLVAELT
jgi:hypothetical protein